MMTWFHVSFLLLGITPWAHTVCPELLPNLQVFQNIKNLQAKVATVSPQTGKSQTLPTFKQQSEEKLHPQEGPRQQVLSEFKASGFVFFLVRFGCCHFHFWCSSAMIVALSKIPYHTPCCPRRNTRVIFVPAEPIASWAVVSSSFACFIWQRSQ